MWRRVRRGIAGLAVTAAVLIGEAAPVAASSPDPTMTPGSDGRTRHAGDDRSDDLHSWLHLDGSQRVDADQARCLCRVRDLDGSATRVRHRPPDSVGGRWRERRQEPLARTEGRIDRQGHPRESDACGGVRGPNLARRCTGPVRRGRPGRVDATRDRATRSGHAGPRGRAAPAPVPTPQVVHPGAFCAPSGASGVTTAGTPMVCGPASDGRNRWHSA